MQAGAEATGVTFREYVRRGTDPTSIAVMLEDAGAVAGLVIAGKSQKNRLLFKTLDPRLYVLDLYSGTEQLVRVPSCRRGLQLRVGVVWMSVGLWEWASCYGIRMLAIFKKVKGPYFK